MEGDFSSVSTPEQVSDITAEGQVSYFKARETTRVATPANEDCLLNIALCGTASHVEDVVRGYRRALVAEELSREAVQQRDQHLWFHTEADGSLSIRGRIPAEIGALFKKALQAAEDRPPIPENVPAGTFSQSEDLQCSRKRRVEALATLAESFQATGPRDLSGSDRQQIVVHVDAETFQYGHAGRCELEHGPAIASETARRLACDCSVIRIVEDAKGEPLDVGRRTQTIPPGIRRALQARDRGCRFHHRLVHEGQVVVQTLDDGAFRYVKPSGEAFDCPAPSSGDWSVVVATHESAEILIPPSTSPSTG